MNSRPKQPKYARNKNVVVIGGSGSGKTRFFVKPNLMQLHSSLLLTACGKKDKTDTNTPADNAVGDAVITAAPSSTPKISEKYNSIDDANKKETREIRDELLSVAGSCKDIYEQAEKGNTFNVVLDDAVVQAMVTRIGQQGYSAVDYLGSVVAVQTAKFPQEK